MRWTNLLLCGVALALTGCQAPQVVGVDQEPPADSPAVEPMLGQQQPRLSTVVEPVGSDDWRMTMFAEDGQIEGYPTRASGPPGTRLGLKISTTEGRYRVFAYRIGYYKGGNGTLVWSSRFRTGQRQAAATFAPYETRTIVAPWQVSLSVNTGGWRPGLYVFRLRTGSGWENQIPYVVTSPSTEGAVVLGVPVTTWQAYNVWGGYSLYDGPDGDRRSWAVSFNRPYKGVGGMNDFRNSVVPIVTHAETTGVKLAYLANLDLDRGPEVLAGARGYVSMGHDEYWTTGMRATVLAARAKGTNVAFLGANTMYWRVRLAGDPSPRLMTGYRHDAHLDPLRETQPTKATSRFRDDPAATPENDVTGMLYECYPVDADYRIVTPRWFGFRGTDVRAGTAIHRLVGGESDRVYPNARTPRPMQILSHVPFSCRGDSTTAQAVYFTTRSGAGVFSAGTLRWGCAIVDRCDVSVGARTGTFVRTVTTNLLRAFIQGPVGLRHPARDNVDRFDLPLVNTVSAS